jgi:hypothetical protein
MIITGGTPYFFLAGAFDVGGFFGHSAASRIE